MKNFFLENQLSSTYVTIIFLSDIDNICQLSYTQESALFSNISYLLFLNPNSKKGCFFCLVIVIGINENSKLILKYLGIKDDTEKNEIR